MRWLATMFCVTMAFNTPALLTSNLVADWQGGVGITATGGRISQWNDQHALLNNDGLGPHHLAQTNAAFQPYAVTDAHGYAGVLFPWAFGAAHPNDFMNIPGSLTGLKATNLTVYIIATGPVDQERGGTMIWFNGLGAGWIRFFLAGNYPANYPANLAVGASSPAASPVYPPLNRAVFVGCGDTVKTTLRWNNVTRTNAPQSATSQGAGGTVAVNNGAIGAGGEWGYSGLIYRILVYAKAHTAAEMDAQVAELAALGGVQTNYTKQAVCRGASTVEGVGSSMLQSFPFQMCQRYPGIRWHNQGIGGLLIGPSTNYVGQTMYDLDGNFVDPLYDAQLEQNWLLFFGGINDLNSDGISGLTAYGRLTNYVAARKAAHPWTVVVGTITPSIQDQVRKAEYNSCIRTNAGGWDRFVDPGYNSPVETRLNNYSDTNYFAPDGLHLSNAGYGVLADHFGPVVNVPQRTTGFFGP